jgi:hypothetical protein
MLRRRRKSSYKRCCRSFAAKTLSNLLINSTNFLPASQNYNDMLGELYLQCEMPEPPKESFFKGLFGGGTKSIDREELCKCPFLSPHLNANLIAKIYDSWRDGKWQTQPFSGEVDVGSECKHPRARHSRHLCIKRSESCTHVDARAR